MRTYKRSERVQELMLEEIADIIRNELKDPRIGFVTVMRVEMTQNLRHANVFVSPMGSESAQKATFKGITSAVPAIRRLLGQRMKIRFMPELSVKWDHGAEHADTINRLLHEIEHEKEKQQTGGDN